jgi:ChaB
MTMPDDKRKQAEQMRRDVPSTIARSDDKAVRTFKETLESAEATYGGGERARRTAFAALKHTHEKVGDHWEPKGHKGPSDPQAARGAPEAATRPQATAQGVDVNASKRHLDDVARRLGIEHPEGIAKDDLIGAIEKANRRVTAQARKKKK